MSPEFDKKKLLLQALEQLEAQRSMLTASALEAKAASTHEESKAENKYDTRGLEASYLAAGQAKRVKNLEEAIFILKKVKPTSFDQNTPIGLSALVLLGSEKGERWVFLIPANGIILKWETEKIQTMSLHSPIGQLLINSVKGDFIELKSREYSIIEVY